MLGFTAGTILSTNSIPYRLLGLNGVFLLIDAILNSPYTYIAKYTTLIGVGSYYILKDTPRMNQFTLSLLGIKDTVVETEETEETAETAEEKAEKDIYADMPPLISLEEIAAAIAAEMPLPPSPPDTDDDLPPPLVPIPDTALILPVEETVPEEFVPVFDTNMD
jgi:hypothetical protein